MVKKIVFLLILSGLFLPAAYAKDHEWTGFLFKGGIESNPEKGGPFRTPEQCFAWGKAKVWRASDKYACGLDCKKDAVGRSFCRSIETEDSIGAALAKLAEEEKAEEAKKAEGSAAAAGGETPVKSKTDPDKTKKPVKKSRFLTSERVLVS